jgi:hypothetical protein
MTVVTTLYVPQVRPYVLCDDSLSQIVTFLA